MPDQDSIKQKIKRAEAHYFKNKDKLFSDKHLAGLLQDFKSAARESHKAMEEIGLILFCRDCEIKEGGSCCGQGLENNYSETLLLINLLLSVPLPRERYDPKSCFFLGESGCLLTARHVICVNYLCTKITTSIKPEKISLLREKEGTELNLLFLAHERVKKLLTHAG